MRRLRTSLFLAVLTCLGALPSLAWWGQCPQSIAAGINLAGAEFGKNIPGREDYDYFFPTKDQMAYYKKMGFRAIRLPVMWERLQPKLNGDLDQEYLEGIISVLKSAADNGMTVLVDLHNYARYRGQIVGGPAVPAQAFSDLWQKIARALSGYKALEGYGLMNEPYGTGGAWPQVAQSGIDGIRSVDGSHHIYVSVENSGDARIWASNFSPIVKDPKGLEVYEAHVYFDADYSGRYVSPEPREDPAALVDESVKPFIAWLAKYGKKGAIGEWGVPNNDARWFPAVDRMVEIARTNCLPIYYWAGGNWGPDYKLAIPPQDSGEAETLLAKHFEQILAK